MSYLNKWVKLFNKQPLAIQRAVCIHLFMPEPPNELCRLSIEAHPEVGRALVCRYKRHGTRWYELETTFKESRKAYLELCTFKDRLSTLEKVLYDIE